MDFRELRYIVAIAKHKNISKAAGELFVTQPTLTKFLQNLEKEIGQPIFKKIGNKFLLTYAGERYVSCAKEMLELKNELDKELSDIMKENIGELKIAYPVTRGTYMLPNTLPAFKDRYPLVKVKLYEEDSTTLEEMLLNGDIDIAFLNLPLRSRNIDYEIIKEEEIVLVASADHYINKIAVYRKGCKNKWIDLKRLEKEEFILTHSDQRTRQIADKLFKDKEIHHPNITLLTRNVPASVQLAINGYGLCFAPEFHLSNINLHTKPAVFSVGNPRVTMSFVAAYRKDAYLPNYAKDYIQIVKEIT